MLRLRFANMPLGDSPPNGWMRYLGNEIGLLKKEQKVIVTEKLHITDIFWAQEWVKLLTEDEPELGWVYNGTTNLRFPCRLCCC